MIINCANSKSYYLSQLKSWLGIKFGDSVVGFSTAKIKSIKNLMPFCIYGIASNNFTPSNFSPSTFKKAISAYTAKYNDYTNTYDYIVYKRYWDSTVDSPWS